MLRFCAQRRSGELVVQCARAQMHPFAPAHLIAFFPSCVLFSFFFFFFARSGGGGGGGVSSSPLPLPSLSLSSPSCFICTQNMASRDDSRVVRVFVEDLSAVLADDVHDWLKIIGDIEEVKVQYDTAQQRSFYWVHFKHASAAQLAVNYLDGERLKNYVVHIYSSVYTKQSVNTGDAPPGTQDCAAEEEERIKARANPALPLNHRMPRDLQMDEALVNTIPTLLSESGETGDNSVLVQTLRQLQESYCRVQEELQAAKDKIMNADEEVVKLLRGDRAAPNHVTNIKGAAIGAHAAVEHGKTERVIRRIHNSSKIPTSLFDSASLLSKLTRYVGPVTDYSFTLSADGHSFHAVVEFFHADDAALALSLLKGRGGGDTCGRKKRTRWELDSEEALTSLVAFGWGEDTSLNPLQPPDLSLNLLEAHNTAASMLWPFVM